MKKHSTPELSRPPGREIYRDQEISIFEVFGYEHKLYCQCLCLLSKLFLEDKALFFCIGRFVFYICVAVVQSGVHFMGYFSRQLDQADEVNILSCITVLPPFQRKGIGRLLIALAYEMAKLRKVIGGPERPLSDLGSAAFMSYWKEVVVSKLFTYRERIQSFEDLMRLTSMTRADISAALREPEIKVRHKGTKKQIAEFNLRKVTEVYEERMATINPRKTFDSELLVWLPEGNGIISMYQDQV
jgi:histone acetyltransferase MYST1